MAVRPPDEAHSANKPIPCEEFSTSAVAEQKLSSKKDLIIKYLEKSRFPFQIIPFGRAVKWLFGKRIAKRRFIKEIKQKFVDHLQKAAKGKKDFPTLAIEYVVNTYLIPKLKSTAIEDLQYVERFIDAGGSVLFLERGNIQTNVTQAIAAMKKNPEGVAKVFSSYPKIAQMMGNRFSRDDHVRYIGSWIELINKKNLSEFGEIVTNFETFIEKAQEIQKQRPNIFIVTDLIDNSVFVLGMVTLPIALSDYLILRRVASEITDSTTVVNTQMIHENLRCFIVPPSPSERTIPILERRFDHPLSLSREFHPDIILYEDSDDEFDFQAYTNLAITNEKTMETRTLRLKLPFSGIMTKTEARKLLAVLEEVVKGPGKFDTAYDKSKLDPKQKEERRETFLAWEAKACQEQGKLISDFNATDSRPAFTFAREDPSMAAAISKPSSLPPAVKAAKTRNIFLLVDGSLSLLPPECPHPNIGQLPKIKFEWARGALKPVKLPLPKLSSGAITFEDGELTAVYEEGFIGNSPVVWLSTTVKRGKETITRKTAYFMEKSGMAEKKIEEISASGLLERDFLLAKAEFLDAHV